VKLGDKEWRVSSFVLFNRFEQGEKFKADQVFCVPAAQQRDKKGTQIFVGGYSLGVAVICYHD
jgi:hypothetical protein